MNSRNKKNIKELQNKSKKGELFSSFQLYQNYLHGQDGVESNPTIAQEYFDNCINYIEKNNSLASPEFQPTNKVYLDSLELFDFRAFSHLRGSFENDLTVIIGDNGKGKTSILNAIAKTLSWVASNILREDGAGQRVSDLYDIKRGSRNKYTDILTDFNYGNGAKRISARLSRAALGVKNKRESDIKLLKYFADIFRIINDKQTINLPLFAFYSVERSHPTIRSNKENTNLREERFDAYTSSLVGAGKFEHFIEWFISLHKKAENDGSAEISTLQEQVSGLEHSIANGVLSLEPILRETQDKLVKSMQKFADARKNKTLTDSQRMKVVVEAICNIIPSINNIWVETSSGSDIVMVNNDSINVQVEQLSDGQRVFLSLVSDIVRRLIMLNPKLVNPLEGLGIVLIDEVELHLHPKWQQNIVPDLQKYFPNLQLIITTHSPLVLSTIDKRNIRLFDSVNLNETINLVRPKFQTKGVINSDVLEQIMGTFATPQNIRETHLISDFERALNKKRYENNEEAKEYFQMIMLHFGEESSELKKCKSLIRIQSMKLQAQKKLKNKD